MRELDLKSLKVIFTTFRLCLTLHKKMELKKMLHFFNVTFPFSLPQVTALVTRLVGLNFELMQQVAVMKTIQFSHYPMYVL